MTEADVSLLQQWMERHFLDISHRLLMLETAVNDIAKTQATSGEINAMHVRLTTIEQRLSQLELRRMPQREA